MIGIGPEDPRFVKPTEAAGPYHGPETNVLIEEARHLPHAALVGYRAWRVNTAGVYSVVKNGAWTPGQEMVARCIGTGRGHAAPNAYCRCGIYALREGIGVAHILGSFDPHNMVLGEVYLWGRIRHGYHGYRAEKAYPKSFLVVGTRQRPLVMDVLKSFKVPITYTDEIPHDF